jgi:hypothetical protein
MAALFLARSCQRPDLYCSTDILAACLGLPAAAMWPSSR